MSDQADTTQTQDVAPDTGQQETAAQPDPIMARMDELTQMVQGLQAPQQQDTRGLTEHAMQQFQPVDTEPDEPEYGFEEQGDAQAEARAYQELQQLIQSQVQQGIQSSVQPFITQQKAQQLEQKYPDLKDPAVVGPMFQKAQQLAQQIGNPDLAYSTEFIETFYLAERARQSAAQETPADGGTGVHMEGQGAQPQVPQVDERDRIVALGTPNNTFGW